jgi:rRNA maturation RNase YbeY
MKNNEIRFFLEDCKYRILDKQLIKNWLSETIILENKILGYINIIICTDNYLYELNQKYLAHDTLTDIITFDLSESNILLGEIYISIDRIKENARMFNVAVKDELHRVMVHGVLHLCGYKDKTKKDKEQMTIKEDFYLSKRTGKLCVTA